MLMRPADPVLRMVEVVGMAHIGGGGSNVPGNTDNHVDTEQEVESTEYKV